MLVHSAFRGPVPVTLSTSLCISGRTEVLVGRTSEFRPWILYINYIPNESIGLYCKEYEYAIIFGVTPLRGKLWAKDDGSDEAA